MTRSEILVATLLGIVAAATAFLAALGPGLFPGHQSQIFAGSAAVLVAALGGVGIVFWQKKPPPKPIDKEKVAASWISLSVDIKNRMAQIKPEDLPGYDAGVAELTRRFEKRLRKAHLEMLRLRVDPPPYPFEFTSLAKFLEWWTALREEGHKLLDKARGLSP